MQTTVFVQANKKLFVKTFQIDTFKSYVFLDGETVSDISFFVSPTVLSLYDIDYIFK